MSLLHIIVGHLNCFMMNLRKLIIFLGNDHSRTSQEVPVIESEKGLNHRIYYVTTKDFNTFSETKLFLIPISV